MSRRKGNRLDSLLADLSNTAPKDFDPENFGADSLGAYRNVSDSESDHQSESDQEKEAFDGRAHYVKVGRGSLRMKAGMDVEDSKYQGRKASRLSLYEDSADEEFSVQEDDDDHKNYECSDDELAESKEGFEFEENDEDAKTIQKEIENLKHQEAFMISKVASGVQDDAEKGKHVRAQMALFDHFLDTRIRLQKAVNTINCFPKCQKYPSILGNLIDQHGIEYQKSLSNASNSLIDLIDSLLSIRMSLIRKNRSISKNVIESFPETFPKKRDFKEMSSHDNEIIGNRLSSIFEDIQFMDKNFMPYTNHVIEKWNTKVQMASAGSALAAKKFKAINQSVMSQINQVLQDKERLLKRCRLRRDQQPTIGEEVQHLSGDNERGSLMEDESPKTNSDQYDKEIFDDMDFYQMMLKEFIESKMSDADDPVSLGMKVVQLRQLQEQQKKKKKKSVDTKASKGRKIRYHVHEKLVNFMAPQPRGSWHDDMREQLFKSILGSTVQVKEAHTETSTKTDEITGSRKLEAEDGFTILVVQVGNWKSDRESLLLQKIRWKYNDGINLKTAVN